MGWILVEGLDRSGKSSVAEDYRKKGYTIVHMEAPSKKYYSDSYSGETYFEELVRMYSQYEGKNVLFDRTVYGELVWPNIYGRKSLLEPEDLDYLSEIERNNEAEKILMYDANTEAHWQRCVDNNEPLTRAQFGRASIFYERLSKEYGFKKKQLADFPGLMPQKPQNQQPTQDTQVATESVHRNDANVNGSSAAGGSSGMGIKSGAEANAVNRDMGVTVSGSLEQRLELANTIREVLQSKILKKKGGFYDHLEQDIKAFLEEKLQECFTGKQDKQFSDDEIMILKLYAKRIKEKM